MNRRSIPEIREKIVNNHQIYSLGNKHNSSYAICSPKNEWGFWYEQGEDWTEIDVESYYNAECYLKKFQEIRIRP